MAPMPTEALSTPKSMETDIARHENGISDTQPGSIVNPVAEPTSPPPTDQDPSRVVDTNSQVHNATVEDATANPVGAISKNQLKKRKRQERWEEKKESRKRYRKEKRQQIRARKRETKAKMVAEAEAAGLDPATIFQKPPRPVGTQLPITLIVDCSFEEYMAEKELVSLASQLTRAYSDNRIVPYRAHLFISSFQGKLKERFETVYENTHKNWKGVHWVEGNYIEAAKEAQELMTGPKGGEIIDILKPSANGSPAIRKEDMPGLPTPDESPDSPVQRQDIVYLTSESPYSIDRLEPNTCYVIGGLVDKNREKGLCYRRAREAGVRHARLPIAQYMVMQSRVVLATNHVVEIMLRWLETGHWGEAFLKVIPKRKGGVLRGKETSIADGDDNGTDDDAEDDFEEDPSELIEKSIGGTADDFDEDDIESKADLTRSNDDPAATNVSLENPTNGLEGS